MVLDGKNAHGSNTHNHKLTVENKQHRFLRGSVANCNLHPHGQLLGFHFCPVAHQLQVQLSL